MFYVARELMSVDWVSQSTAKKMQCELMSCRLSSCSLHAVLETCHMQCFHTVCIVLGHVLVCIYHQNTSVCVGVCVCV
jgi:hypothetical protein